MSRPSLKEVITEAVLKQLPESQITKEEALGTWWVNIRRSGGLRLTPVGQRAFEKAEIQSYDYPFPKPVPREVSWPTLLLEMDNKLKSPYYIGFHAEKKPREPFVKIYDSKVAVMISLYGNIFDYMRTIKSRRK